MPTLTNNAEGLTNGTVPTTGNTGGTSGTAFDTVNIAGTGAIVADNAHARGSMAYKITGDSANNIILQWLGSLGTVAEVWGMCYFYLTANPAVAMRCIWARNVSSQVAAIRINTSGQVELHNAAASVIATSTTTIPLNAWFAIKFHIKALATNGILEAEIYTNPNSNTPTETLSVTTAALLNNLDRLAFGRVAAASPNTFWVDNMNVNTTGMPALIHAQVDIAHVEVTTNSVNFAYVEIGHIEVSGLPGNRASVHITGVWVTGRRPPESLQAGFAWMAYGGSWYPLQMYQAKDGVWN